MKIVHSFWSKPFKESAITNDKSHGGWRHPKYHYMSWALSCLSFKSVYNTIELVTDTEGKELLIDTLKLPYTTVQVALDRLHKYPAKLWAVGKLQAYAEQEEPFLHVDGDVYIWEKFHANLESAPLVGQHLEREEGHYKYGIKQLEAAHIALPKVCSEDFEKLQSIGATNAGILGGNNIQFFKNYVRHAFTLINENLDKIGPTMLGANYALIYEQYLFSVLARAEAIAVVHFLDSQTESIGAIINFERKYERDTKKFVHLLGDSKMDFESCRELEMQLCIDYPEYHQRIVTFLADTVVQKDDPQIHFLRTLETLRFFKKEFELDEAYEQHMEAFATRLEQYINDEVNFDEKILELCNEIYAIEKEKVALRGDRESVHSIFKWETKIYRQRELLLGMEIAHFLMVKFQINPYVEAFESYRNWSNKDFLKDPVLLAEILNEDEGNYFFVLQKTGSYDEKMNSNILEFPISEYQYFFLSFFKNPIALQSAVHRFEREFECNTPEEKDHLRNITEILVRELIFKGFIIRGE